MEGFEQVISRSFNVYYFLRSACGALTDVHIDDVLVRRRTFTGLFSNHQLLSYHLYAVCFKLSTHNV